MTEAAKTMSDIQLLKSENLRHIPTISRTYTNLRVTRKNQLVKEWLEQCTSEIVRKYGVFNWDAHPVFRGYLELHDEYTDQKGIPSSSKALIDLILRRCSIPNINTFVDIYNAVSCLTGISIGAHDLFKLEGAPRLEVLQSDKWFKRIGNQGREKAKKGEYCYLDDAGIICRMDIKQCERTKITLSTQNIFVIFQGHRHLGMVDLQRGVELLDDCMAMIKG